MGAALAGWASVPTHADIHEGSTLVSVLPDAVMSLHYATPVGVTTLQRSTPGAPFQVLSTFADDRPAQRCTATADMDDNINNFATLTARRSLSLKRRENEFPVQLGIIDVRDAIIGEPSGPVLVFANENRTAVAVILDGRAAEVTLEAAKLRWLETVCSGHAHE
jgi:hypothetical protein